MTDFEDCASLAEVLALYAFFSIDTNTMTVAALNHENYHA